MTDEQTTQNDPKKPGQSGSSRPGKGSPQGQYPPQASAHADYRSTAHQDDDEISLAELYVKFLSWLNLLKRNRKLIIRFVGTGFLIGLFVAFFSREEYEAQNVILSYSAQADPGGRGDLRGLAGLAGVDIGASPGGLVSEEMFPTLLSTYPLASKLAEQPLRFQRPDTTLTGFAYFDELFKPDAVEIAKDWTIGLPRKMIGWALAPVRWVMSLGQEEETGSEQNLPSLSAKELLSDLRYGLPPGEPIPLLIIDGRERSRINQVAGRVETERERRVITIKATMPDPYAAADLANAATRVLMQELTNFEIRKTRDQIAFLEKQYDEVRERFERAQREWFKFRDRNTGVVSALGQIEAERLQTEFSRASNRYSRISDELDRARYRLNEETPLFTELDPVQVPRRPASPNRPRVIILWVFLGGFLSTGFITARHLIRKLEKEAGRG